LDFIIKLLTLREPLINTIFDNILIIVYKLTKYAYFILYKEANTAKDFAYIFIKEILNTYGMLKEIISNRDKLFTSKF